MAKERLGDLRKEIDAIDSELIRLINRRGCVSQKIGGLKIKRGQSVYSPDRESQIYSRLKKKNKGPVEDDSLMAIYREIMSACISLERPLKVAFLGPELTFTYLASTKKFGSSVNYLSCDGIPEAFNEVEKGNADYGVVPIENSTEGAVNHTLDMFVQSDLVICSEIYLPVAHSFLSRASGLADVEKIYSHPHVFGQCRRWIEKNTPHAKLHETTSTVRAADIAGRNDSSACIANEIAAKKYGLRVLARNIEDTANNVTRFLVVGKKMTPRSGKDKTSIMFSVKDRPGILHDMLNSFKKYEINLTKIESRPSKKALWKYYFFIDMEGHIDTPKIKKTIKDLEGRCHFLKILGSYPKGDH
jgi:chorismate mutase/prephenate dehydratase